MFNIDSAYLSHSLRDHKALYCHLLISGVVLLDGDKLAGSARGQITGKKKGQKEWREEGMEGRKKLNEESQTVPLMAHSHGN